MEINVIFDSSATSAPASFKAVVEDVAKYFDAQFSNPITINIDVGWGEVDGQRLGKNALGESISHYTSSDYTYAQIRAALTANAESSVVKTAVASLTATDPTNGGQFTMTTAEAKALGLIGPNSSVDGYAGFSASSSFDFGITVNNSPDPVPSSEYDFFAVVAHEFSEILGRQMNFGISYGNLPGDGSGYDPLDLFDYSNPGVRSLSATATEHYFSLNGGNYPNVTLNSDASGDLFDWASSAGYDAFDAFSSPGVDNAVAGYDLDLMNLLGYQPNPDFVINSVPQLSSFTASIAVVNSSYGPATASETGLYISATSTVTRADTRIAEIATGAIAPRGAVTATGTFALPSDLAAGTYYVAAIADVNRAVTDADPTNNTSKSNLIYVLDDSNFNSSLGNPGFETYDLSGLSVDTAASMRSDLTTSSALGGTGVLTMETQSSLWLDPGTTLTIAGLTLGYQSITTINTSLDYAGLLTDPGGALTVAAGKTFTLSGSMTKLGGPITGAGVLAFDGGEVDFGFFSSLTVTKVEVSGASTLVSVAGPSGSPLALRYAGDWDQAAGTLTVASGNSLKLSGAGDTFTGVLSGAGTISITGSGDVFRNVDLTTATISVNASKATMAGTIGISGVVSLTCPDLVVSGVVTHLTGGGTLKLSNHARNEIVGAAATSLLDNAAKITGSGQIGAGSLRFTNEAAGIIDANTSAGMTIDTGAATIINRGLIEAAGAGSLVIKSVVNNTGTLGAIRGNLTVDGAVSGAGVVKIIAATASFAGPFSEAVTFGSSGELVLAQSSAYAGTISHFSTTGTTSLDLEDIAFGGTTMATYSGTAASGVLTVSDGTHTAHIKLAGNFTASTWSLSSDGHGGTTVVDPTTPSAAPLTSAIAAFAPGPAGLATRGGSIGHGDPFMLVVRAV
jgi:hypothetical protein